jgi:uncharacterized protein YjdB
VKLSIPSSFAIAVGLMGCASEKPIAPITVASIEIAAVNTTVQVGQTQQLNAIVKGSNGATLTDRSVTWSSADTTVATVSQSGVVNALKPSVVAITATSEGKSGTKTITVARVPVAAIRVILSDTILRLGTSAQASVAVMDQNGSPVTDQTVVWTTSNDSIARVTTSGLVTGGARGQVTISATLAGVSGTASLRVKADYRVTAFELPFSLSGITSATAPIAINTGAAGIVYAPIDGTEHLLVAPSFGQRAPELPIHHFVKISGNWKLVEINPGVTMGAMRDFTRLDNSGSLAFADHGLETPVPPSERPYGDVWHAKIRGITSEWTKLSNVKAFNHSITSADLNGDGLKDVVALNMASRPWSPCRNLTVFLQVKDGAFRQDTSIIECVNEFSLGSGAVLAADLNEDGIPEIIEADYINRSSADFPVAFTLYERASVTNGTPRYRFKKFIHRAGRVYSDPSYGATKIFATDVNGDKHVDLIVTLENTIGAYENTIDIWLGDGRGNFQPSNYNLSPPPNAIMMRELEMADVNRDGKPDFVLNSWNPVWWDVQTKTANLENLVWINTGAGFKHPSDFKVKIPFSQEFVLRWFSVAGKTKGFFISLGWDGILRILELELLEDFQ